MTTLPDQGSRQGYTNSHYFADIVEALHERKPALDIYIRALKEAYENGCADADEARDLRAENEMLRDAFCDEAYILMVQALDVKALPKGRKRILTEQAVRMAKVGLRQGDPRHTYSGARGTLQRRAGDVLAALVADEDGAS